jgi:hypothetical protein
MLVWMTSVILTLRVWRIDALQSDVGNPVAAPLNLENRISLPGGIG